MCKIWLYYAKKYIPDCSITIFFNSPITEILQFAKRYSNIRFIKLPSSSWLPSTTKGDVNLSCHDIKCSLWQGISNHHLSHFIYADADAFILDPLTDWWKILNRKPFIAIPERIIQGHLLYNAGVFSLSDSNFLSITKLKKQYKKDNYTIVFPSSDQGLINAYLYSIKYDAQMPQIDYSYNCLAKFSSFHALPNNDFYITSGKYSCLRKFKRRIIGIDREWWENWLGWNKNEKIKILHSFGGSGFKFWELPECKSFWNYSIQQIT